MFLSRIIRHRGAKLPSQDPLLLVGSPIAEPERLRVDPFLLPNPPIDPDPEHERPANARLALSEAFAPTWPQADARRFVGREAQLARIRRALAEEHAHVVLHGEAGRGKTSLANMVAEAARAAGVMVAHYACSAEDDFDTILRGLAAALPAPFLLERPALGDADLAEGCASALPEGRLRARDLARLLGRLTGDKLVLIIDEFDRVTEEQTRARLTETMKQVSDLRLPLSFVVVGVADDLEGLLGRRPALHRQVLGVRLPLLSEDEVEDILERGEIETGVAFPSLVRSRIRAVARGAPHVTHLLALRAGQAALERGAGKVTAADLDAAIGGAIEEAEPRVVELYDSLVEGGRNRALVALLRGIVTGPQDAFGRFQVEQDGDDLWIGGSRVDPALWRWLIETGSVRPGRGGAAGSFVFTDPALHDLLLMQAGRSHAGTSVTSF